MKAGKLNSTITILNISKNLFSTVCSDSKSDKVIPVHIINLINGNVYYFLILYTLYKFKNLPLYVKLNLWLPVVTHSILTPFSFTKGMLF